MRKSRCKVSQTSILVVCLSMFGVFVFTNCSTSIGDNNEGNALKAEKPGDREKFKGFKTNIENSTLDNQNFRKVLYTSQYSQLVLMSLKPGEEIGVETHPKTDQFFRFEGGTGKCMIDDTEYEVKDGDAIVIPAGARHNVMNTNRSKELKVYTVYSPPVHKDGIVRKSKQDAEKNKESFDGVTSE